MKVALVHDYLFEYGGAERVLEALHDLYPDAPVYTAFVDRKRLGIHWQKFQDWDIHESFMTKIPLYKQLFSPLRLFAIHFFEQFDFSEYDVVISSSNAYFAKGIITKSYVPHICYCHTPPRSLYGYSTMTDWKKNPLMRLAGNWINSQIKEIDYLAAQRVDQFVANSLEVQKRIKKFYGRESVVIYPPVNVPTKLSKKSVQKEGGYYLFASRLAFSKHPEIAVKACTALQVPLKVVGVGKMMEQLKQIAGPTVGFLGQVSDEQLDSLYDEALALLYPVEDEDFGIVPVEAMGHGVPVIAHRSGGPMETVIQEKTGVFFDELSVDGLVSAMDRAKKIEWNHQDIFEHARAFRTERFQKQIDQLVHEALVQAT